MGPKPKDPVPLIPDAMALPPMAGLPGLPSMTIYGRIPRSVLAVQVQLLVLPPVGECYSLHQRRCIVKF